MEGVNSEGCHQSRCRLSRVAQQNGEKFRNCDEGQLNLTISDDLTPISDRQLNLRMNERKKSESSDSTLSDRLNHLRTVKDRRKNTYSSGKNKKKTFVMIILSSSFFSLLSSKTVFVRAEENMKKNSGNQVDDFHHGDDLLREVKERPKFVNNNENNVNFQDENNSDWFSNRGHEIVKFQKPEIDVVYRAMSESYEANRRRPTPTEKPFDSDVEETKWKSNRKKNKTLIKTRRKRGTTTREKEIKDKNSDDMQVLKELGLEIDTVKETVYERMVHAGDPVVIPCNLTMELEDDVARLILWFKDNSTLPVYTYDNRHASAATANHWSNTTVFTHRESLYISTALAELRLKEAAVEDSGEWRCRVDYRQAPTTTNRIRLIVIGPPAKPRIVRKDTISSGKLIDSSLASTGRIIGPYKVGQKLGLTCLTDSGDDENEDFGHKTRLTWHRKTTKGKIQLLDETFYQENGQVRNDLPEPVLTREDLNSEFICRASTPEIRGKAVKSETTVKIDMILQPSYAKVSQVDLSTGVEIQNYPREPKPGFTGSGSSKVVPVSAGKTARFRCEAGGARPNNPTFDWWIGEKQIFDSNVIVKKPSSRSQSGRNVTVSILTFTPQREDGYAELRCRARNELFPSGHSAGENQRFRNLGHSGGSSSFLDGGQREEEFPVDRVVLDVKYTPSASISLGSKLNGSHLKEGDDVYFECRVDSNPKPVKIEWRHQAKKNQKGRLLEPDPSAGVIVSGNDLVLQNVDRQASGFYSCSATNTEGVGVSQRLELDIKYKPFCAPDQALVYGVASVGTPIEILCKVQTSPSDTSPVKFDWAYNSSSASPGLTPLRGGSLEGQAAATGLDDLENGIAVGRLSFMPQSETELGNILCWSTNSVGRQSQPCVFKLINGRKPDPIVNCSTSEEIASKSDFFNEEKYSWEKKKISSGRKEEKSFVDEENETFLKAGKVQNASGKDFWMMELKEGERQKRNKLSLEEVPSSSSPLIFSTASSSTRDKSSAEKMRRRRKSSSAAALGKDFETRSRTINANNKKKPRKNKRLEYYDDDDVNDGRVSSRRVEPVLRLKCQPGFNGGLRQNFTMEIRHAATNQLVFNQTKLTSPDFAAFGLKSSTGYIVTFFAANTKGFSKRLSLNVLTRRGINEKYLNGLRDKSHDTNKNRDDIFETNESALIDSDLDTKSSSGLSVNWELGSLFGVIASALALVIGILFLAICLRRRHQFPSTSTSNNNSSNTNGSNGKNNAAGSLDSSSNNAGGFVRNSELDDIKPGNVCVRATLIENPNHQLFYTESISVMEDCHSVRSASTFSGVNSQRQHQSELSQHQSIITNHQKVPPLRHINQQQDSTQTRMNTFNAHTTAEEELEMVDKYQTIGFFNPTERSNCNPGLNFPAEGENREKDCSTLPHKGRSFISNSNVLPSSPYDFNLSSTRESHV